MVINDDIAIKVERLSKTFKLPHEKNSSIKGALINFRKRKKGYEKQRVLNDISFEIKKGEFFGIVGRNGSGKSTLLKLLAGIYTPDKGSIQVNGTLTPFIELGVGFNPELTGRENVFLNGALLGFSRREVRAIYDEIVAFAELGRFMDQKLKNYSSGMQVRLAFSIAIQAKSDILVLDEVLAVGDTAFQKKCYEYFMKLKENKRTVVLVTHDMGAVERFCDRAMVIDKGEFKGLLKPREAAALYEKINLGDTNKQDSGEHTSNNGRWGTGKVRIKEVALLHNGTRHKKRATIHQGSDVKIEIQLTAEKQKYIPDVVVGLAFYDQFGVNLSGPNSIGKVIRADETAEFGIANIPFNPGEYYVTVAIFDKNTVNEFDHIEKAFYINVTADSHQLHGKINLFGRWGVKK